MAKNFAVSFEAPASQEIVKIALDFVYKIEQAHQRLCQRNDDEALHDMRVAMRSLWSTFCAYPEVLSFKKKFKKELKQLASFTNPARDAEVRVEWLKSICQDLPLSAQKNLPDVIAYAERQTQNAYHKVDERVSTVLQCWLDKVNPAIEACSDNKKDVGFGNFFAKRLGNVTEQLDKRLHAIENEADYHSVHETRIIGKQVRYLLDPLQSDIRNIKPLIKELKKLQDLLGDFHDTQVRLDWLEKTVRTTAGEYGLSRFKHLVESSGHSSKPTVNDAMPVLLAITRLSLKQQKTLFSKVLHEQQSGHYQELISRLRVQAVRSRR